MNVVLWSLRYLSRREQRLLKRRKAAEEVLKQQQELLKKEQILDREEEKVNKLVNKALACYQQRERIKKVRAKEQSIHSGSEEPAARLKSPREMSTSPLPMELGLEWGDEPAGWDKAKPVYTKSSISEEIGASGSITEEISEELLSKVSMSHPSSALPVHTATSKEASDYALDTFEQSSLTHQEHPPQPIITSTPSQDSLQRAPQTNDLSISISGEPLQI